MIHIWHWVVVIFQGELNILEINTQADFPRLLFLKQKFGYPSGMMNLIYDPCIQQFIKIFLYEGFKWRMYLSQLFLIWLDSFLDWDDMLDDPCVISFQVIIHPCEHISVLFEQADEGMSFFLCTRCAKINKLWILFCSQVYQFVPHGGNMGLAVSWPLESLLQVI